MKLRGLVSGTFWILSGQVATRLSGMLAAVIIARILGPKGLGELSLIRDIGVITVPIFTFGISQAVVRAVSRANRNDADREEMSSLFGTLLAIMIAACVIGFILMAVASPYIARFYKIESMAHLVRLLAILMFISVPYELINAVLTGLEQFKAFAVRELVSALLSPIVIYLCVSKWGVAGAIISSGVVNLFLLSLLGWYLLHSVWPLKVPLGRPSYAIIKDLFAVSLPLLGSILLMRPLNLIGSSALVLHAGLLELGWFRIAYTIYGLTMVVPSAIQIPLLPLLSKIGDADSIRDQGIRIARLSMILGMPLFVVGILLAGPATTMLFGKAYEAAKGVVALMLIVGFVAVIVSVLETNMISQGKTFQQFKVNIINILVFVIAVYIFVPLFAHWGLAIAYFVTEIVAFGAYAYIFHKHSRGESMRLMMPALCSGATICLVFAYIQINVATVDMLLRVMLVFFSLAVTFFMLDVNERALIKKYLKIGRIQVAKSTNMFGSGA